MKIGIISLLDYIFIRLDKLGRGFENILIKLDKLERQLSDLVFLSKIVTEFSME